MRASSLFLAFAVLLCALAASSLVGSLSADFIEARSARATQAALENSNNSWAVVETDGLQVKLSGIADSEAQRFSAITAAAAVVDATRLIDQIEVVEAEPPAPEFSIEILRTDEGVSLIGLIPAGFDIEQLMGQFRASEIEAIDLTEASDFPIPPGFETAADFGARATVRLPRSKVSVTANMVRVTAAVESLVERTKAQAEVARLASDSFVLDMDIRAPRPVVTPFTLRFLRDGDGARFDVCTADSEKALDRIRTAAIQAGLSGQAECTIGLGTPSPKWGDAVVASIRALGEIGEGSLTISDADVTMIAAASTAPELFDRVAGELQTELPDAFSLHAVLTPKEEAQGSDGAPQEFLATLSPEGQVQLRGRVSDALMREAVTGFAHAKFGSENVYVATRPDRTLPKGWPLRVLTALDALSRLNNGSVLVQRDMVTVKGTTGNFGTKSEVSKLLSDQLGEAEDFAVAVAYSRALDPQAQLPTPKECLARVQAVQIGAKISFEPGKATIDESGMALIEKLAAALTDCEDVPIEVGGHTDSQGREVMNQALSQTRAEAVIDALLARRVLTSNLFALGYGESEPIADNDTEDGREANRRIEFRLMTEDEVVAFRRSILATDGADEEDADEQN